MTIEFNNVLYATATETIGKGRTLKKSWMNERLLELCDERRKLKKEMKVNNLSTEYRICNKKVRKEMKKAKEKWIENQCSYIEDSLAKNNSKKAFKIFKELTCENKGVTRSIQDSNGNCLIENEDIMNRWTEYCKELYNQPLKGNPKVLEITNNYEELSLPILKSEIEKVVKSLKKGKSPGNDIIPGELVQAGGEKVIEILTLICNRIWTTGIWPKAWTQSLIITIPKKGNLKLCNNYRTISLISHPSKVLLNVILNSLRPQAENIIAEEQAGFRVGRSTSEQIFNIRMLCEKYTHDQQYLYNIFIDFKKAFDRV